MNKQRNILLGLILLVLVGFFAYQKNVSAEPNVPEQTLSAEQQEQIDAVLANPQDNIVNAHAQAVEATEAFGCAIYGDMSQTGLVFANHVQNFKVFALGKNPVELVAECTGGSFIVSSVQIGGNVYLIDSDVVRKIDLSSMTQVGQYTVPNPDWSFDKIINVNGVLIALFLDDTVGQGRLMALNPDTMTQNWVTPMGTYVWDMVEGNNNIVALHPNQYFTVSMTGQVSNVHNINFPGMRIDYRESDDVAFIAGGFRSVLVDVSSGQTLQYIDHSHIARSATIGLSQPASNLPSTPEYLMGADAGTVVFGLNLGSEKICTNGVTTNGNTVVGAGTYLNSSNFGTSYLTSSNCTFGLYGAGNGNPGMSAFPYLNQEVYLPSVVK